MPRSLELLLAAAAAAIAVAFVASVPYWPREALNNPLSPFARSAAQAIAPAERPRLLGPSVLASLRPVPTLNLELPADIAVVVQRRGMGGETGLIPTAAAITTFRLRATGDLVFVAAPTGLDPVRAASADAVPAVAVHGMYAVVSQDHGATVIRWTENGVTYEISSRTIDVIGLAQIANQLR